MSNSHHLMIDDQAFDDAKNMMQQKFPKIIGYYLEDVRIYIDTIQEGVNKQDASIVVPAAHTIKSSSRQIGAFALGNYAAAIEEAARHCMQNKQDFKFVIDKTQNLEVLFQATEKEIRERI